MALRVREKPPLGLDYQSVAPSGRRANWGPTEPDPANVPSGESFTDSMPGGFSTFDCTLPRKPGLVYPDLERLSEIRVLGLGGEVVWEGRLERAPRTSGNEVSVSPSAVGHQAHLDDDKSAQVVYVGRDISRWGETSRARRLVLDGIARYQSGSSGNEPDSNSGLPGLTLSIDGGGAVVRGVEAWYDGGSAVTLASLYYDYTAFNSTEFYFGFGNGANDGATNESSGDLLGSATGSGTFTPATARRHMMVEFFWNSGLPWGTDGVHYYATIRRLAVFGNHGLTKRGTAPDEGYYASDIIAHALSRWAPLLNYSTGTDGSIQATSWVLEQLAFFDPTTVAAILTEANRVHLNDWAVWEDRTFYYHPRGARGRKWRASIAPSQLSETGPSVDRLWNGIVVRFSDVDGSTRTVGPTGSGATTETADLLDADETNPANQAGIRRWDMLDMSGVSTAAIATEVGRRFLEESKLLDSSGQATLTGYVEDDRGIVHPYWRVRAGDQISFTDAAETSYRRIVKTSKSVDSRSCTVDLDAPPEGMDMLLERLNARLLPLGL